MKVKNLINYLQTLDPDSTVCATTWTRSDVKEQCESLTDEQCDHILNYLEKHEDANTGISYDTVRHAIRWCYPKEPLTGMENSDD